MTIRMRNNHQVTAEIIPTDHLCGYQKDFFVQRGMLDGEFTLYSKDDWELVPLVPIDRWEDITESCEAEHSSVKHGDVTVHNAQWYGQGTYRLRKVKVKMPSRDMNYMFDAFIVKRKVPS